MTTVMPSARKLNVLVLDDDYRYAQHVLKSLESALPKVDIAGHVTHTVVDAIRQAETHKYDVVFIDVVFDAAQKPVPIEQLSEKLKQVAPDTRFILYSSYADVSTPLSAQRMVDGADFIFRKPSSADLLSREFATTLAEFVPRTDTTIEASATHLVVPVRQTISVVNREIIARFRQDPALLRSVNPDVFERLVAELFVDEGYEVVLTPPRKDGGKDLYAYKKTHAADTMLLVECKRYVPPHKVGVEVARQVYGVFQREQASGGVIATTSYFTAGAKEFAQAVPYQLFLRDFDDLSAWLQRTNRRSE